MNQYERKNAVSKVEGYDLRVIPNRARQAEFEAAKRECLVHLRAQLANVEALTFDQYIAERRERTTAEQGQTKGSANTAHEGVEGVKPPLFDKDPTNIQY
jgi:hypothetical protein